MKMKIYCLVLFAITGILCIQAPTNGADVLTGIDKLNIAIVCSSTDPNVTKFIETVLAPKVKDKLNKAHIKAVSLPDKVRYMLPEMPELKIYFDIIKINDAQQYVFRIQPALSKNIYLTIKPLLRFKADVWKLAPSMQAVSVDDMGSAVTKVVTEQLDTFIAGYRAANQKGIQKTLIKKLEPVAEKLSSPAPTYQYVASKNSKVFHEFDCSSAKQIVPENRIGYNNPTEAITIGKRPCKICKP